MSDKNNIVVGSDAVTGGIQLAPLGTPVPTTATGDVDQAFAKAGFVASEGLERNEKIDTENITAWGVGTVRVVKKSTEVTVGYSFIEYLNPVVQKAIYGDANVTSAAATEDHGNLLEIAGKVDMAPHRVQVIDMVDGDVRGRLVFPDSQITSRDKYTAKDNDSINRGVTWTLFPDDNGEYFHEYWDDGRKRVHVLNDSDKQDSTKAEEAADNDSVTATSKEAD
ncbi:hypothetical protein [Bifidobacterium sp. ESL0790]|uniref:phage tail tube protein n=1 Tax=Bifidobacterium sp. ESL0790 TaxID=2983233 RepID=UPI0023F8AE8B|nr:hypothetical protein [Bifidobacterium sp. ESL0790]WEV72151.1 hypothetical protein OZY47_06840 [Bifidobacterium sp. ESL0790]